MRAALEKERSNAAVSRSLPRVIWSLFMGDVMIRLSGEKQTCLQGVYLRH